MTQHTQAREVSEEAVRMASEVRVVFSRLRRRLREVADTHSLTPSQVSALSRLSQTEVCTASALAAAERVRPQSMAATLAALEHHGLVRRDRDPADGRRQIVSLTPDGREALEGNRHAREEWLACALQDRYSDAELRVIGEALPLLDRLTHP